MQFMRYKICHYLISCNLHILQAYRMQSLVFQLLLNLHRKQALLMLYHILLHIQKSTRKCYKLQ